MYAYELLFRSDLVGSTAPANDTDATRHAMEAAWIDVGMNALVGGKLAFVNFTRELLLSQFEAGLPPKSTVIEVLETIEPDREVIRACERLKRNGYTVALDDFVYRPGFEPLLELADIVKIGFGECDPQEQCDHVRRVSPYMTLLAEKVDTAEDYERAVALGFRYFQGWFFCRPETLSGRALTGSRLMYLKLIEAVRRPDLDVDELEEVIRSDVSLAHRFLKFLGSAAFGWEGPFTSVRHGLALLGIELTRRWVNLMSLDQLADGKPRELLVQATLRAKVCEELGRAVGLSHRTSDLFFVGSLSLIDSMLDLPMDEVLKELPLAQDLEAALLGRPSELKPVLDLAVAYERGDWDACDRLTNQLGVDRRVLAARYQDAVFWASELFKAAGRV